MPAQPVAALVEPFEIADVFATALFRVEALRGGIVRFWLATEVTRPDGAVEQVLVARIVMPLDAVGPGVELVMQAIGGRPADDGGVRVAAVH